MLIIAKTEEQTQKAAFNLAKELKRGDIVLLFGEMGAGKTVFAKGFAAGLEITDEVTSPTYTYVTEYGDLLYHFDCYRLTNGEQFTAMGLDEYFYLGGICLIEWPQNISDALPENTVKVTIKKLSGTDREIEIVK